MTVAFHAGLFNIGGEGQAQLGGLGVALVCLFIPWPHWTLALLAAMLGAALFGAAWAAIPAYLQAKRGSHIVITTIMFNFIAAALLIYCWSTCCARRADGPGHGPLPRGARTCPRFGRDARRLTASIFTQGVPANVTFFIALVACVAGLGC